MSGCVLGASPPPFPGGYVLGEQVYYTGSSEIFEDGDRLEQGKHGEVAGAATNETHTGKAKSVAVLFPECDPSQISREPPPPLPGGYLLSEQVYYTGSSETFVNGNRLEHGKLGEVAGPATSETHKGESVAVLFPGNTGLIECYLSSVSREPPPPFPGGYLLGDQVYYTGDSQTFEDGDRLEQGTRGEVMGPATIETDKDGMAVLFSGNKEAINCRLTRVSREPPPPTTEQLAAQHKENERQAKKRAREACQQQLAAAIEAGELETLREALDAADQAGCFAPLLKQARGRRDALRKAARRLERQAAVALGEEEARRQRERQAAEVAAEEEKARVEAAEERATAKMAAARFVELEEEWAAAAEAAQAKQVRRHKLLGEQEVAERKAKREAAEEAARLAATERARECGGQRVQSAATGDDAVGAVARLLGQASLQVSAGSSDAGAATPGVAVAPVAPGRPSSLPIAVISLADAQFDIGRPQPPESTIGGQTTCIVCFSNRKSHAAVPCGHQCACDDCSAQMNECPVCRNPALMWMQVRLV